MTVNKFDFVILDCGYGRRFVQAFEQNLFQFNDAFPDQYVRCIAIHSGQFHYQESNIYCQKEFDTVLKITDSIPYEKAYGKLTMQLIDVNMKPTKIEWGDICNMVTVFNKMNLCGYFEMNSLRNVQVYEKEGTVCELTFDTEWG